MLWKKKHKKETAMESETPKDREVEPGGYLTEETTKEKAVNNVVEENTQSNVSKKITCMDFHQRQQPRLKH